MKKTALAIALGFGVSMAHAQDVPRGTEEMWVGGGIGMNQLSDFDDSMGYQVLVGHNLVPLGTVRTGVEVGFMDTGTFEGNGRDTKASGAWASGVAAWALNQRIDLLGRVGLDFGDDDGLLWGLGAAYRVSPQVHVRGEWVQRDTIDSLQANIVYFFR